MEPEEEARRVLRRLPEQLAQPIPMQDGQCLVDPVVHMMMVVDATPATAPGTGPTPRNLVNASGAVTEASAANINSYAQYIYGTTRAATPLHANAVNWTSALDAAYAEHRIYTVPIHIAAGGAVTNVALHAAQAGYCFHFKVLGMWSSVSDATTSWWFHSTAGSVDCIGCPPTPGFSPVDMTTAYTMKTALAGAYMNNPAATGDVTLLDVAGVAHRSGAAKGATGRPVGLLTHFVLARAASKA
jgi:hypothetical protein